MTRLPEPTARRYGKVFDEIATEYDRSRPAYPDELLDQACRVAGIGNGDHVLEVGCGTGQLTRGLLARGLHVTALEPGKNLIALARQNLAGAGEVEFVNAQFEEALFPRERFQAVFSASAFHWVDPKVSWQKAADVLVPGGTLALVQYCGLEEPRTKLDQEAAIGAVRKVAPDIAATWPAYRDLDATLGWDGATPWQRLRGMGLVRQLRHRAGLCRQLVRRRSGGSHAKARRAHSGRAQCPPTYDVVLRPAFTWPAARPRA